MAKTSMDSIIPMMESWYRPFPKLPAGIVDFLVMVAPWFALIFGVLGVLGALTAFGVLSMVTPSAMMYGTKGVGLWPLAVTGGLVSSVLTLLAFPGLRDRKLQGWTMLFWAQIVSVISTLLGMNIGGIIGAAISFYVLFQVKARYK